MFTPWLTKHRLDVDEKIKHAAINTQITITVCSQWTGEPDIETTFPKINTGV